jgi:hypothetical protein
MTVAEMSRVDLTSDGWASSGGDAGESGDGIWRSYRTNHRPGWHPTCAAFRAVRTVTSEADAPVGDLPGHYRRLATDIPLPAATPHIPLWPGQLQATCSPTAMIPEAFELDRGAPARTRRRSLKAQVTCYG